MLKNACILQVRVEREETETGMKTQKWGLTLCKKEENWKQGSRGVNELFICRTGEPQNSKLVLEQPTWSF